MAKATVSLDVSDLDRLEAIAVRMEKAAQRVEAAMAVTHVNFSLPTKIEYSLAAGTEVPDPSPGSVGHGHVTPREDGWRARCGGPGVCVQCSRDAAAKGTR